MVCAMHVINLGELLHTMFYAITLSNCCFAIEVKYDCITLSTDRNQGRAASTWLSWGVEMACNVPQFSPSHYNHCFCPSCFPQGRNLHQDFCACVWLSVHANMYLTRIVLFLDSRVCTSQEIWIPVHENSRCHITAVHTSFERTRLESSGRGYQ
jgi:hypothetical protein